MMIIIEIIVPYIKS